MMPELLNDQDFSDILQKASDTNLGSQSDSMTEVWRTWGFDPDAVGKVAVVALQSIASTEKLQYRPDYAKGMMAAYVMGMMIGCLAMLEVELRRASEKND